MKSHLATALVLGAGLAVTVGLSAVPAEATTGQRFTPARDDEVVERFPSGWQPAVTSPLTAEATETRVLQLLTAARQRGGDARLLGQARAALDPWWTAADAPPPLRLLRATLKQSMHDFEGALVDLDALVRDTPADLQVHLTRATVLTVLGRAAEATQACAPITDGFVRTLCRATPLALSGALDEAAQSLEAVRGETPALEAWRWSVLGEVMRWKGDAARAEQAFRQALTLDATDAYTRLQWADLRLEQGRAAEVPALFEPAGELTDGALLLVVLALQETKGPGLDAHREDLEARLAAARLRGETLHRREAARAALGVEHDAERALQLAVENWQVQREPADARVLLEAAVATRRPDAAADVLRWLDETKLPWPVLRALAKELRP